jgi:hypothetical protein
MKYLLLFCELFLYSNFLGLGVVCWGEKYPRDAKTINITTAINIIASITHLIKLLFTIFIIENKNKNRIK